MSDPSQPEPTPELPPDIPPPPDIRSPQGNVPTYGSSDDPKGRKKSKDRSHPTDTYPPLRQKRGCGRGCGCFLGFVLLLLAALAGGLFYFGPGRFVSKGYQAVNLGADATVDAAPTEPTCYFASGKVDWQVPVTTVPVAIIAREIHVVGDFHEEASITGVKVIATESARFAKDLEVIAAEFTDLGITLKGELTGRVMKSLP